MMLFSHMLNKDLREHRWLVIAWLAYQPIYEWSYLHMLRFADEGAFAGWSLALALRLLGGAAVISAFVHGDPTTGPRAAWRTRPVGWGRLLAVKLSLLGALIVFVPALMRAIGFATLGFPITNSLEAALFAGLFATVLGITVIGVAVVTPGPRTFWTVMVAAFAILPALTWGHGINFLVPKAATVAALAWPNVLVFVAAGGALAVSQYRMARTATSVALLAGLTLPTLGYLGWTLRWPMTEEDVDAIEAGNRSIPVELQHFPAPTTGHGEVKEVKWDMPPEGQPRLRITPRAIPAEPNTVALVTGLEATLRRADGSVWHFQSAQPNVSGDGRRLPGLITHESLSAALQLPSVFWVDRADDGSLLLERSGSGEPKPPSDWQFADHVEVRGSVAYRRFVPLTRMRFALGASVRVAGAVQTVSRLRIESGTLVVTITNLQPQPIFHRHLGWVALPSFFVAVLNRARREAFVLGQIDGYSTNLYFPGIGWEGNNLFVPVQSLRCQDGGSPLDSAWLAEAELLIYRAEGTLGSGGEDFGEALLSPVSTP